MSESESESESETGTTELVIGPSGINPNDVMFKVNRDDETNEVCGFSLTAVETNAECYCLSFPTAQAKGKGDIYFGDGKIHFAHGGVGPDEADPNLGIYGISEGGLFSAEVSDEDAEELAQLLERQGKYAGAQIRVRHELAWSKGFTLYTKTKGAK